jgi:hypothetical protein
MNIISVCGCSNGSDVPISPPGTLRKAFRDLPPVKRCCSLKSLVPRCEVSRIMISPSRARRSSKPVRMRRSIAASGGRSSPKCSPSWDLPSTWNRRINMFGNGGYAGESLDSADRVGRCAASVRRGFVVADTDTGHAATPSCPSPLRSSRSLWSALSVRHLWRYEKVSGPIPDSARSALPHALPFSGAAPGGSRYPRTIRVMSSN